MLGFIIIFMIGAVGSFLLYLSFKQLTTLRIFFHIMGWRSRTMQSMLCFVNFTIGNVLVLAFIFIPAAFGIDMDLAFFSFIFAIPFFLYKSLFVNKLKF